MGAMKVIKFGVGFFGAASKHSTSSLVLKSSNIDIETEPNTISLTNEVFQFSVFWCQKFTFLGWEYKHPTMRHVSNGQIKEK